MKFPPNKKNNYKSGQAIQNKVLVLEHFNDSQDHNVNRDMQSTILSTLQIFLMSVGQITLPVRIRVRIDPPHPPRVSLRGD
jgi:hypothetical protein